MTRNAAGGEMEQQAPKAAATTAGLFFAAGLLTTIAALLSWGPLVRAGSAFDPATFSRWMSAAFLLGFAFRVARRKILLGGLLSWHKAFSFEALFQGAILLNPQLPYPSVEREFLARHTGLEPDGVSPWFHVRGTSAVAIPLLAVAIIEMLAGRVAAGSAFLTASFAWVAYRSRAQLLAGCRVRFVCAVLLGMAAMAAEGAAFVAAARIADPAAGAPLAFLLYTVLLTAFELSPVPGAMGVLEAGYVVVAVLAGTPLPGLALPLAYRFWRAVPVLLLSLFYLPRYKMSLRDLFDARLGLAIARARRFASPEPAEAAAAGPLLSVILPAYNEARRLPRYLNEVRRFCAQLGDPAEILVVDDGSTDDTAAYVESVMEAENRVRLVRQDRNRGKGAAVRRGVSESRGRYILFADADGATPIGEATRLLAAARSGADVVIGSRKVQAAGIRRDRSALRALMGSIFYRVTNLLAVPGIADTQCGFKMFTRSAARRIFPQLTETGWAFDVEILFLAQKFGMVIEEVPVNWTAVEGSKIRPRDVFRMLMAILRIRRRAAGLTTGMSRVS